jgi:competence protein ComEA
MRRGSEGKRVADALVIGLARLTAGRRPGSDDGRPGGDDVRPGGDDGRPGGDDGRPGGDDGRPGVRLQPSRHVVVAAFGVAVLSCLGALVWVLLARPRTMPASEPAVMRVATSSPEVGGSLKSPAVASGSAPPAGALPDSAAGAAKPGVIVVDVVGQVRRPGVFRLPAGSRVEDALRAAGGLSPGAKGTSVNRARLLSDGEQVAVGVSGAPTAAPESQLSGGTARSPAVGAGTVDLNRAGAAELDALPGVGPVLAQHILEWRSAHGRFESVDDLKSVSGIGAAKFAELRNLVTVG